MKPKNLGFSPNGIQLGIGFLYLFKGSLGKNSMRLVLGLRAECIESAATSLVFFHDR